MGACKTCGRSAGLGRNECGDCEISRAHAEMVRGVEARISAAEEHEVWRTTQVEARTRTVEATVASGRGACLIESIYVAVDSVVNDESVVDAFDLEPARRYAAQGWELCGVVPRTVGIGLKNVSVGSSMGKTWGAGLGGNVVGVHLIFRYAVDSTTLEASRATIEEHFRRTIP